MVTSGHPRRVHDPPVASAAVTIDVEAELSDRTYEGPFDLLLQLILAEEVDIYEVSLACIVDAYLVEVEKLQQIDLDVATEFLLIAATLVELKARRLLPGRTDVDLDDEFGLWEERDLLLARLLDCKTFKDVSGLFAALVDDADRSVARRVGADERFAGLAPDLLTGLTPMRLRDAAIRALTPKPVPRIDLFHVAPVRASVADAVAELVDELPTAGRITFARLTASLVERLDVIVRFLAVLELYKQGLVELDQTGRFGDIGIEWCGDAEPDKAAIAVDAYEG
jgi:segregation and condensation protein A